MQNANLNHRALHFIPLTKIIKIPRFKVKAANNRYACNKLPRIIARVASRIMAQQIGISSQIIVQITLEHCTLSFDLPFDPAFRVSLYPFVFLSESCTFVPAIIVFVDTLWLPEYMYGGYLQGRFKH